MSDMAEIKAVVISILISVLLLSSFTTFVLPAHASASIELEEFRWNTNRFPISVYVDLNQWSTLDYSVVIREALDNWIKAIWNYTNAYDGQSLAMINFTYYVKNVNSTRNPDVIISFVPDVMKDGAIGLTTYEYDDNAHEPIPPITINITTYSAAAPDLFVENVAMHEFGHALGVGHASSSRTDNGPEIMYYAPYKDQISFPSTLDVYALKQLYEGHFNQTVQLPTGIQYVMLPEGSIPPIQTAPWQKYLQYLPLITIMALIILTLGLIAAYALRTKKDEGTPPLSPPPPSSDTSASCVPEPQKDCTKRFSTVPNAKAYIFQSRRAEVDLW